MPPLTSGSLASGGGIYRSLGSPLMERFAIEVDEDAALAYQANYSDAAVWIKDASRPKVIDAAYKTFGAVDILTSGMPCQDFSTANSCDRINSEKNELYLSALDWVERFRPKAYLAENVANVTKQIQWDQAVDRLRSLGYRVVAWTLDARRFGVPQQRIRVFLIAIRDDYPLPVRPIETHGPGRLPFVSWANAMLGMTEEEALSDGIQPLSPKFHWTLQGIPPHSDWRWILENLHIPGNLERMRYISFCYGGRPYNNQVASRLCANAPSHTLLTSPAICRMMRSVHPGCGSADAEWEMHPSTGDVWVRNEKGQFKPVKTRLITVREYKRLFEVPDNWILPSKSWSINYRILGNGICPRLYKIVCEAVARAIGG